MTNKDLLANEALTTKKNIGWLLPGIIALIIALIPFCCGKYYEFHTKDAFDSALNVYHAHEIVIGKKIGIDLDPSAGPGTLMTNTIGVRLFGYSEFGPKLIQTIMQFTALAAAFCAIRRLYGNTAAIISVTLGSFYLSLQPFAKFGNVKEQYMIACMIYTAVSFIYYEFDRKKIWLYISGFFAINAWYYKPTGLSILIAVSLYLIITTCFRQRAIKQLGSEIMTLIKAAGLGLIPIMAFYSYAGDPAAIYTKFPAVIILTILILYSIKDIKTGVIIFLLFCLIDFGAVKANYKIVIACIALAALFRFFNFKKIKSLPYGTIIKTVTGNKTYLYSLSVFVIIAVITFLWYITAGQGKFLLRDQFFSEPFYKLSAFIDHYYTMTHLAIMQFYESNTRGYIAGSRSVSIFSTQLAEVCKYSHSFIVITGMALAAFVNEIIEKVVSLKKKPGIETTNQQLVTDRLLTVLFLWWIIDMLMVWVSPRAYVQYFLPPNASGIFLAGYLINRIIRSPLALILTGIGWLTAELISAGNSTADFSKLVITFAIILIAAGAAMQFMKLPQKTKQTAAIALFSLAVILANSSNISVLKDKIKEASISGGGALWEHVGKFIRDNSTEQDQVYVWGWYPGIYVESHRSCPSRIASYSNMHSDNPQAVSANIKDLLEDMKKNPPFYIVDSQKMHYPFYDHPVFDLWPTMPLGLGNEQDRKILTDKNEIAYYIQNYDKFVEKACISLTTNSRHSGGPVDKEKAEELAKMEVQRHECMLPLREFVMQNYTPYKRFANMVLYKRK